MNKAILFYTLLGATVSSHAQNLYDINTVQQINIQFARSDWDFMLDSMAQIGDDYSLATSVTINGQVFNNVGVKYKGNSSYNANNAKNSFSIKLDYVTNQNYQNYEAIKLNNGFKDPSFVREVLGYEIARKYTPAPLANWANVSVNGVLHGVYTNVQDANKYFLGNHFAYNDGAFFKCDPAQGTQLPAGCTNGGATFEYLGNDTACYYNRYEINSDAGWENLRDLCNNLNNSPSTISNALNVDRALWMLAFNNILVNMDSYTGSGHNYYAYQDLNGRFNTLVWDLNECFGVFTNTGAGQQTNAQLKVVSPTLHINATNKPLMMRLLANPMYRKTYIAHLRTILAENFTNGDYLTRAQQLQAVINSSLQADNNKFFTMTQFTQNLNNPVGQIVGIRELMFSRDSFLRQHSEWANTPPTIANIQNNPSAPTAGQTVYFTAQVGNANNVKFRYRTRANHHDVFTELTMLDNGQNQDGAAGDGVYGISLSVNEPLEYYIYAENANAALLSPERAEYEFYSLNMASPVTTGLVINELMISNGNTQADNQGEFEDWVELYNNSNAPISLNGLYLSDDFNNPTKWAFPDTTIAANGYLIVWADNDTIANELHAFFKLNASGEELMIADGNGLVMDSVSFDSIGTDVTWGRYPNGTGNFRLLSPTFNSANTLVSVEKTNAADFNFILFPNPNKGEFVQFLLNYQNGSSADFSYQLNNSLGQMLQKGNNLVNQQVQSLYIGDLAAGVYWLTISNGRQQSSQKLIIQR